LSVPIKPPRLAKRGRKSLGTLGGRPFLKRHQSQLRTLTARTGQIPRSAGNRRREAGLFFAPSSCRGRRRSAADHRWQLALRLRHVPVELNGFGWRYSRWSNGDPPCARGAGHGPLRNKAGRETGAVGTAPCGPKQGGWGTVGQNKMNSEPTWLTFCARGPPTLNNRGGVAQPSPHLHRAVHNFSCWPIMFACRYTAGHPWRVSPRSPTRSRFDRAQFGSVCHKRHLKLLLFGLNPDPQKTTSVLSRNHWRRVSDWSGINVGILPPSPRISGAFVGLMPH